MGHTQRLALFNETVVRGKTGEKPILDAAPPWVFTVFMPESRSMEVV